MLAQTLLSNKLFFWTFLGIILCLRNCKFVSIFSFILTPFLTKRFNQKRLSSSSAKVPSLILCIYAPQQTFKNELSPLSRHPGRPRSTTVLEASQPIIGPDLGRIRSYHTRSYFICISIEKNYNWVLVWRRFKNEQALVFGIIILLLRLIIQMIQVRGRWGNFRKWKSLSLLYTLSTTIDALLWILYLV